MTLINPNGLNDVLQDPLLLSSGVAYTHALATRPGQCIFSHLPRDFCVHVLEFLPTSSVLALRLAFRIMASVPLGLGYWRSRFEFPNELSHIKLPKNLFAARSVVVLLTGHFCVIACYSQFLATPVFRTEPGSLS